MRTGLSQILTEHLFHIATVLKAPLPPEVGYDD
jgi:hypothetical protein